MKKFLRNLFSGYFLVLLILLLELAIFVYIQFFMDDLILSIVETNEMDKELVSIIVSLVYLALKLIVFIVALIIFFKIVNKPENPEFKIPWIVGMLLLPFFTSVLFIIFGNHGLRKQDRIIVTATVNSYNAHFKLRPETAEIYEEELGHAAGTFKYIHNVNKLGVHRNNRVTYYKCGEEFFPAFIEGVDNYTL